MAAMKAGFAYACALLCVIVALSASALADDTDFKKQFLEQIGHTYIDLFNKQDATGLAALYATGAIIVDPVGPHTDIVKVYEGAFNAGINHIEVNTDQAWPLGSDTTLGMGKYRVTGKNPSGASIEDAGLWTATFVREGGKWKVRMLTTIPQPPAK
jgi:ketosteroid isomerase-like protein